MNELPPETSFTFPVIGYVHSCYKAKFGIPRQPGLIREATGYIQLCPPYNQPNALRGLEDFSHLWVMFIFHQNLRDSWKATVRPPRLGGDKRIGVFASRSPFRPSPIGLSVVELIRVEQKQHGILRIHVKGLDMVDGTPIVDLKPYVPYTDSIPDARGGFAMTPPEQDKLTVKLSPEADAQFASLEGKGQTGLRKLATDVIAADPRPAYQKEEGRVYGVFLQGFEIVWQISGDTATILSLHPGNPEDLKPGP